MHKFTENSFPFCLNTTAVIHLWMKLYRRMINMFFHFICDCGCIHTYGHIPIRKCFSLNCKNDISSLQLSVTKQHVDDDDNNLSPFLVRSTISHLDLWCVCQTPRILQVPTHSQKMQANVSVVPSYKSVSVIEKVYQSLDLLQSFGLPGRKGTVSPFIALQTWCFRYPY